MVVMTSNRLKITKVQLADANFILELYNDPDFIRFIGDRGLRTLSDAENFITKAMTQFNHESGNGLFVVSEKNNRHPLGICSYLKRDFLDFPDIGFAFLPQSRQQGYALEATTTLLKWIKNSFSPPVLLGIAHPENTASHRLLKKLGFVFEKAIQTPGSASESWIFKANY
ncbi:MAG: GNAT family N-acetyltransferase [Oligoflexia bacterium]|nr:GNAT family N-acetyltransferase [Oligoflexia bacterium]